MTHKTATFDDSGVSETIGYILVFAIVLTGIAGIVLFGVTMLNDAKDRNNFQNIEQGLNVVQSDMKRVALEKAPLKTTRMHVEGGTLATNITRATVQVEFDGHTYSNTTGDITYYSNTGLKKLSIENGGLWKTYGGQLDDLVISQPRVYSSPENNEIVVNVVRINGTPSSFGGAGTVNLAMRYGGTAVYTYDAAAPSDVKLTINTAYPNAWGRLMQETIDGFAVTSTDVTDSSIKLTISGVSRLVISEHTIEIAPFVLTS
jgi:hypothetical protein